MDTSRRVLARKWQRLTALLLAPLMMVITSPLPAMAQAERISQVLPVKPPISVPNVVAKPVKVKMGTHQLKKFNAEVSFSAQPTDVELSTARVLSEPLTPMTGQSSAVENKALAAALLAFHNKKDLDDVSDLTKFLAAYPNSRWRASLELNLGHRRFQTGFLTEAMNYWNAAWNRAKNDPGRLQKRVANAALAELLELNARVGRMKEIQALLPLTKGREFLGSDEQKVHCAIEGLGKMGRFPERAFKCGPYAIDSILNMGRKVPQPDPAVDECNSTSKGTNLLQVKQLADKVKLNYQMAKRTADAPVIVPSVLHWTLSHFGAIVGQKATAF